MRALVLSVIAAASLAACSNEPKFEFEPGVCYFVATPDGQPPRLQKMGENVAQIELCAGQLEEMRLRFLRMGGSNQEVAGAYQGRV
ncbi:MAG: hypothetical protein ACK4MY_16555, partial [Brevundimonas sp.]